MAYNYSVSAIADLIQSVGQSLREIDRNLFRWLNRIGVVPPEFEEAYNEAIKIDYPVSTLPAIAGNPFAQNDLAARSTVAKQLISAT